jgi:hypothetical protein
VIRPFRSATRLVETPPQAAGALPLAPAAVEARGAAAPAGLSTNRRRAPRRWRALVVALGLGGLLFGSVPRSAPAVWQPDRGVTLEALTGDQAADGTTQRAFGMPFRVATITHGPSGRTVGLQPLALLADAAVGAFVLAVLTQVLTQWWQRRRGLTGR